jgi:sulfite reductase (ferredoxin)
MQTDNRSWIIMTLKAKNISTIFETISRCNQSYRSWFIDWGNADIKPVGVGECAGVVIDLELYYWRKEKWLCTRSVWRIKVGCLISYAGFVNGAKALLLAENQKTNHQGNHRFIWYRFRRNKHNSIRIFFIYNLYTKSIKMNPSMNLLKSTFKMLLYFDAIEAYRNKDSRCLKETTHQNN